MIVEERAALEFERAWHGSPPRKGRALRAAGWIAVHYYLVLGKSIEKPAAEMEYPETVRRLKRLRSIRATERHANRPKA